MSPLSGLDRPFRRRAGAVRVVGFRPPLAFWLLVALLALPLFAHGCHGDDVDHEPLVAPFRLNGDDR